MSEFEHITSVFSSPLRRNWLYIFILLARPIGLVSQAVLNTDRAIGICHERETDLEVEDWG